MILHNLKNKLCGQENKTSGPQSFTRMSDTVRGAGGFGSTGTK